LKAVRYESPGQDGLKAVRYESPVRTA